MDGDTEYIKELLQLIEELRIKIDTLDEIVISQSIKLDRLNSNFNFCLFAAFGGSLILAIGSAIIFS